MAGLRLRGTAALAAGLLMLGLAGCAGAGERFPVERVEPGDLTVDLTPVLLEVDEIPLSGWAAESPVDDDAPVDDESGGVCAMDFTDVMSPQMQATEVGVEFSNEALLTVLSEVVWSGSDAEVAVASIAEEFAACSGEYSGMWGDSAVVVATAALDMDVPGAAASVCRYYQMTFDGQTNAYGPMCVAASGERVVGLLGILLSDTAGLTAEDYQVVMAAATAKAFAG